VEQSDSPGYLFSGTADPTVPYQWSVDTANALHTAGGIAVLTTQQGGGHSLPDLGLLADQSSNFFFAMLNLGAAQH
jgi:predicted esterase